MAVPSRSTCWFHSRGRRLVGVLLVLTGVLPAQEEFRRGDVNADGALDIGDPVALLSALFLGGATPPCLDAADANDDGLVDIADAMSALQFLFLGGPPFPAPFEECGSEFSRDSLACAAFPPCAAINEIVAIRSTASGIEIEVSSSRPFPARALYPILCIELSGFHESRHKGWDEHILIFTLTQEEFDATSNGDLVTVQHGGCIAEIERMRPYWDLWVFGPLDKSLLDRG